MDWFRSVLIPLFASWNLTSLSGNTLSSPHPLSLPLNQGALAEAQSAEARMNEDAR